ncbi:hypothetical protein AXF42_Ash020041 [Apostasia shenzhenica]|uniref:Uncharacterized protein n=1 Tax=Apostasia shenzhenica TaxID=1088818 RepID=A0A2I0B4R1_9ASPA|nr:hypothetical protein AXF42_Ash020041 [Apostasia shenzhenica]
MIRRVHGTMIRRVRGDMCLDTIGTKFSKRKKAKQTTLFIQSQNKKEANEPY